MSPRRRKLVFLLLVPTVVALTFVLLQSKSLGSCAVYSSTIKMQPTLTQDVIDQVKYLFTFLNYPRSGHSILAALLDAHPNMVIAHHYDLCHSHHRNNKTLLFNDLLQNSRLEAIDGHRSSLCNEKNYTLHVANSWQGKYDKYIRVIGDKGCIGPSFEAFLKVYNELKVGTKIPMKVIIPIRNPFDIISTRVLYAVAKSHGDELLVLMKTKLNISLSQLDQHDPLVVVARYKVAMKDLKNDGNKEAFFDAMYDNPRTIEREVRRTIAETELNMKRIEVIGHDNVLEVHNEDLVNDPLSVVKMMCVFFEVECFPSYTQSFVDKVFRSISKTRELIVWPPTLQQMVKDELIQKYKFFRRYSFEN